MYKELSIISVLFLFLFTESRGEHFYLVKRSNEINRNELINRIHLYENQATAGCITIQVHVDVDNAFYVANGSNKAAIDQAVRETIINASKPYELKFGIRFVVGSVTIYDVRSRDPFRGITTKESFGAKMKELHESHATADVFDLYVLFTPDLGEDIGGFAWEIGGFYVRDAGYIGTIHYDVNTMAHEIGHILGAGHCNAMCRIPCENSEGCPPLQPEIEFQSMMCACNSQPLFTYRELEALSPQINANLKSGFSHRTFTGRPTLPSVTVTGSITFENSTIALPDNVDLVAGEMILIKPESKLNVSASRPRRVRMIIDGSINDCGTSQTSLARLSEERLNEDGSILLTVAASASKEFVCGTPDHNYVSNDIHSQPTSQGETNRDGKLLLTPNPSNGNATVTYYVEKESYVSISVTDPFGRTAMQVVNNEFRTSGFHTAKIDLKGYTPGMYLVRVEREGNVETVKLLIE